MKPFLKWAGGKNKSQKLIISQMPTNIRDYYEPMVGGGAILINAIISGKIYGCVHASDINSDLITTWTAIRDIPFEILCELKTYPIDIDKDFYLKMRGAKFQNSYQIASQFIYINRTCYNGLYRVNKSGEFNVPYGNRAFSYDRQIFLEIHSLIKKVTFTCGDYRWQTRDAEPGDFVYLDPPYDDCFNGYSKEKFSQRELANYCRVLHKRGVKFIVSNKDTPRIRNLFRAFNIENIGVFHSISASSKGRSVVGEVLIKNY